MPSMTAVQTLLARRSSVRVPRGGWASIQSRSSSWVPARAQAYLVTAEEVEKVRALAPSQVRALAASQIQKARDLYSRVSGSEWHNALTDYVHWRPFKKLIEDAQESLDRGDKEPADADRKESYISAFSAGQLAVERIGHEAKLNESDWAAYLDPVNEVIATVVKGAKETAHDVADGIGSVVKTAAFIAALYAGAKFVGGLRG